MRIFFLYLLAVMTLSGCADMRVYKVSNYDGYHDDGVKGFRYYLSRPYVVVKKPIVISDTVELREMDKEEKDILKLADNSAVGSIVSQKITRKRGGEGTTESVSDAEWAVMRGMLEEGKVELASHRTPAPSQNVEVNLKQPSPSVIPNPAGGYDIVTAGAPSTSSQASTLMDTGNNGSGGTVGALDESTSAPCSNEHTAPLGGDIQIIFLPDMDEQYAVHNRNFLGKSSYDLKFKNGWELAGINGEFDSTDVALELIKTIDTAINAATNLATNRINAGVGGGAGNMTETELAPTKSTKGFENFMQVRHLTVIRPGIYRINKPWEIEGDGPAMGSGFLTKLGLDQVTIVTHRVVTGDVLKQESIILNGDGSETD